MTHDDRFLRSILKPKDPAFDAHRRTIFLNLLDNTLEEWHKLALGGRMATEAEENELVKSEMQLRRWSLGVLICAVAEPTAQSNEQMWGISTRVCTSGGLKDDKKLRERLLRHHATETLQTQAFVSALRTIAKPMPFDRAFLAALRESHIQLIKAEADRLRKRRRVDAVPGDTVDDAELRRQECEEWFGGVFA